MVSILDAESNNDKKGPGMSKDSRPLLTTMKMDLTLRIIDLCASSGYLLHHVHFVNHNVGKKILEASFNSHDSSSRSTEQRVKKYFWKNPPEFLSLSTNSEAGSTDGCDDSSFKSETGKGM